MNILPPEANAAWRQAVWQMADQPPTQPRLPLCAGPVAIGSVVPAMLEQLAVQGVPLHSLGLQHQRSTQGETWQLLGPLTPTLAQLALGLQAAGLVRHWHGEALALQDAAGVCIGAVERGITRLLGLPTQGVHLVGVVLYLMAEKGMDAPAISRLLYQESGLKGLSGLSHDVRTLQASDSPAARDALAYFADRCRREIGGLAASLGGLDALVLTGGIGENAAAVRAAILADMGWLGIDMDAQATQDHATVISTAASRVQVLVFKTDEERMLAEHAAELLAL